MQENSKVETVAETPEARFTKLNPNAQKWVEALRSGKYQQTKGYLNRGGGFCCLGVACELAIEEGVAIEKEPSIDYCRYDQSSAFPPEGVRKWLGLTTREAKFLGGKKSLAIENDSGVTFSDIADIIESQPDGLFESQRDSVTSPSEVKP
jgi:hypothetical protein